MHIALRTRVCNVEPYVKLALQWKSTSVIDQTVFLDTGSQEGQIYDRVRIDVPGNEDH
jgi:hypothetical protein